MHDPLLPLAIKDLRLSISKKILEKKLFKQIEQNEVFNKIKTY